ncbi:MAG: hypothetical protein Q8P18_04925 [Pseudomonadota bacterium]|nr:hypothetical protein [Pseudomonadota bacterium]
MLLLWLGSCALRATVGPSERDRALAEADARWEARAEPGNLDAAMDLWLGSLSLAPDDPELLARLARGEWTRGQLEPGQAHLENGQEYGYRCLLGWPAFAARLDVSGYELTPEAAAELPAEAGACLLWTIMNGLGQVERRGPGAALELDALAALLDRLGEVGGDAELGFRSWAQAKLLLLRGAPDTQEVRRLLGAAIAESPDVLLFRVELAVALPDARNQALDGFAPPAPDAWALENAAWKGQVPGGSVEGPR